MARIPLSKIKVVETNKDGIETTTEYLATNTPNTSKAGNVLFACINYKGIEAFQKHGIMITNEESYREMMKQVFPFLTDEMVGERGPNWSAKEDREKIKVFINDIEYNPVPSEKAAKKIDETPKIVVPALDLSLIQAPLELSPVSALADDSKKN